MSFKQTTVVSAEYTQYDPTTAKWIAYSLRTNATDIVLNSANRLFIQNGTHAVNGKKFYTESNGTYTAQAITLYGSDILVGSETGAPNIATAISSINSSITALNTFKNTTVPNTYLAKAGGTINGNLTVSGTTTLGDATIDTANITNLTLSSSSFEYSDYVYTLPEKTGTIATLSDIPGNASSSSAGLMSSTDKSHLDSMWSIWSADGTGDTLVNKVQEVLTVFENMPESSNLVTLLAAKQDKVAVLGSATEPVYISAAGTFSKGSKYAGGTAVTLNGSSKAGSTASFYAPTAVGTKGHILVSNGSGAPTWTDGTTLFITSAGGEVGGVTLSNNNVTATKVMTDTLATVDETTSISVSNIATKADIIKVTVSATAPTGPKAGDIWINTAA